MHLVCPGQHIQYLQQDTVGPIYSFRVSTPLSRNIQGADIIHPAASVQEVPTYPLSTVSSKQETTYLFGSRPWYNISIQKDIIELTYLPTSIRGGATYLSSRKQSGEHIYSAVYKGAKISIHHTKGPKYLSTSI
jgi:hypothetical protein